MAMSKKTGGLVEYPLRGRHLHYIFIPWSGEARYWLRDLFWVLAVWLASDEKGMEIVGGILEREFMWELDF